MMMEPAQLVLLCLGPEAQYWLMLPGLNDSDSDSDILVAI